MEEILENGTEEQLMIHIKEYMNLDSLNYSDESYKCEDCQLDWYNSAEYALLHKNYDIAIFLVKTFNISIRPEILCKYANKDFIYKSRLGNFNIFDLCRYENMELLDYIIDMNICYDNIDLQKKFINQQNDDGFTPLMVACKYSNLKTIKHLFDMYLDNVNININCNEGKNAFYYAIASDCENLESKYEIIKLLLEKKTNIVKDRDYLKYFLNKYTDCSNNKILDLIISKIPDFYKFCMFYKVEDLKNTFGLACKCGIVNLVNYIVKHKDYFKLNEDILNFGIKNAVNQTHFRWDDTIKIIKMLLDNGAKVSDEDFITSIRKSLGVPNYIINHESFDLNPHLMVYHNDSLLQWIVIQFNEYNIKNNSDILFNILNKILDKGVDINLKNSDGKTPIYYTTNLDVIKLFIDRGYDVNKIGFYNMSYIDYIKSKYNKETNKNLKTNYENILRYFDEKIDDVSTMEIKIKSTDREKLMKFIEENNISINA